MPRPAQSYGNALLIFHPLDFYIDGVCAIFFIVLKRKCLEVVVINRNAFFNYNFNKYFTIVRGFSGIVRY